jgi:dipeptidyl aminopeptidase/acylaminoacyl peptidase
MAFTPDLYRCGVSFSGITNLADFALAMPPYWAPIKQRWLRRVGDVTSDAALNRRLSPVFHASKIKAPLLIGQGGNDVRVTQVRAEDTCIQAPHVRDSLRGGFKGPRSCQGFLLTL